jgi:hypothetical protein
VGTEEDPGGPMSGTIVYGSTLEPQGFYDDGERMPDGNRSGAIPSVIGPQPGKLTFRTEWLHGDLFYTLLRGCGFAISGASSEIAKPISSYASKDTLTFYLWEDGRLKKLIGAAGTFTIDGENGKRVFVNWDFDGVWLPVTDVAMPAFDFVTGTGFRAASAVLTFGGLALPQTQGFTININNEVAPRQTIETSTGITNFQVEDRKPIMSLQPESRLVAQHDSFGALLAGTVSSIALVLTSQAADTVTITGAGAQRISVGVGDRDKKMIDPVEFLMANTATISDDDIKFVKSV